MTPYEQVLLELVKTDERILVMTAENRAPMKRLVPLLGERFIDAGIAEQTLMGMAAGLALRGRRPIVHALAPFLTMRSFEFIRTDIGIPSLPVVMVGYIPGFLSDANGPTHQAIEDIALMRLVPGVNVFCPSDQTELAEALPEIVATGAPWYIRYTHLERHTARSSAPFTLGRPERLRAGSEVCILTYGMLVELALDAAAVLESSGVSTHVVNIHTIKPLDDQFVECCFNEFPLVVVLEDHLQQGGLSSAIAEQLVFANALRKGARLASFLPLTLGETWFRPALLPDVLAREGFTPDLIAHRIIKQFNHEALIAEPSRL